MSIAERPVAIVTGAGSGIGQATAMALATCGYRCALLGRTKEKLDATGQQIHQNLGEEVCQAWPVDLCDAEATQRAVQQVHSAFARIDALAHVAGFAPMQPINEVSPELWRRCVDTNLSSAVTLTAAVWPIFEAAGGGVIVNVSSMASIDPFPGFSIYAAAKAGLNMFTKCTCDEGRPLGIRAVCIAPGAVETPMLRSLFDRNTISQDQTLDPADVADVICKCITGERSFEPGETIRMPSR